MKNKTLATWLTFIGGPFGLHRFYLFGLVDGLGWLLPMPTLAGLYGVYRARALGLDDPWSWVLIPLLGFTIAGCAVNALMYGLMAAVQWNHRFNPGSPADSKCGQTSWFTVGGLIAALLIGSTVLLASIAFSLQRYFEYQVEQARVISQPATAKKAGD